MLTNDNSIRNEHISLFSGTSPGSTLARRLIPAAIFLPIFLAILRLHGQRLGLYGTETGILLYAAANITILVLLILRMSRWLNEVEERRIGTQQELDRFFELSIDPMCVAGFDGYFRSLNPVWEEILGLSREELMKRPYVDYVHPEDRPATSENAQKIAEGKSTISFENRYICKDGSYRWLQWNAIPVPQKQLIYAVARDITAQKRKECEIKELNEQLEIQRVQTKKMLDDLQHRYELILQSAGEGIYGVDSEGKTTFVNTAAATLLGYDPQELLNQQIHNLVHHTKRDGTPYPIVQCPIYAAFRDALIRRESEELFWRKDGSSFPVEYVSTPVIDKSKPTGAVVVFRDITTLKAAERDRQRAEEQLRHSQKIEAIGQLASGVAHDFNNILMAISSYSELLSIKLGSDSTSQRDVTEIRKAAQRGAVLTKQLLAFSRKQVLDPQVLDLRELIQNVREMLRRLVPENIQLVIQTDQKVDLIKADPGRIEQVIMNLVVNGKDAIKDRGTITIRAENDYIDEFQASQHIGVKTGRYVKMTITDTGHGMDKTTTERMFEPFFTTKDQGKGTGLGLSTVYGIIKQLGGDIWIYSEPNAGTVFRIYFPSMQDSSKQTAEQPELLISRPVIAGATVLLADDNESVRSALVALLEAQGYKVIQASNGREAMNIASKSLDIQLLITDMIMPELGGAELARQLRQQYPALKIIFLSGYPDETAFQGVETLPGTAHLNKPVSMANILLKVRELLSEIAPSKL